MSTVLDTARTRVFAEQALGIVNGGFLSLMLSVGHRTGLLDTLATLEAATSDRIAAIPWVASTTVPRRWCACQCRWRGMVRHLARRPANSGCETYS